VTDIIKHWIIKAHNDYKTARDEMATDEPATDTVCFHTQQAVEKYLKAYLVFHKIHFRKTHDIAELIECCKDIKSEFNTLYEFDADSLTIYAAEVRYPDDFYMPTPNETKTSLKIALKVMEFVAEKLTEAGYKFPEKEKSVLVSFKVD
jgi:HEPN domain-containing protein